MIRKTMTDKQKETYRKLVKTLTETFTQDELETLYVQSAETGAAIAQAIMSKKLMDKFAEPESVKYEEAIKIGLED